MLDLEGGADHVGRVGVHPEHEGGPVGPGPVVVVRGQNLHHLARRAEPETYEFKLWSRVGSISCPGF